MVRLASFNPAVSGPVDRQRKGLLAKVHMAPKALGMLDDDYRELLRRLTGRSSAKDCTNRELEAVVGEFVRMGFSATAVSAPRRPRAASPVANKARAMWISLHQLAAIDDPSESALEAFGRRQLGVDRLQWADERQGFRLIEALKAMAERHGWDQRTPARATMAERIRLLKDRLVGAQLAKLDALGATLDGPIVGARDGWTIAQLEGAARELAIRLHDLEAHARPN